VQRLSAIDLFSGCGGLSLGLEKAGFRVVGAVELDPLAVETYKVNHPRVRVWQADIGALDPAAVMNELCLKSGDLDLLAGCPPCQGFSAMTTLNGSIRSKDPRNDLVFQFLRYVQALLPKAIMMENVPGMAKDQRIHQITSSLEKLGYFCTTAVLDAADYGVPQRRRRFILLAGRGRSVPFGEKSTRKYTVRKAFAQLAFIAKNDQLHKVREKRTAKVRQLIGLIPKDGGSRLDLGEGQQLRCHKHCDGFKDVYGRMAWDKVAPTITGGCCNPSKGRFLHPSKNRTITLREAALLQSFPPTYFISLANGKFPAAQMIGNALPPEFIRRHAKAVATHLKYQATYKVNNGH
jgi:DNA (cytosine-5)-methyltransferase 1